MCRTTMTIRLVLALALALAATGGVGCGDDDDGETCTGPDDTRAPAGSTCEVDLDCSGAGGQSGMCVAGLCGVQPTATACASDGDRGGCPAGFRCREITVESGTYPACLPSCACGTCAGECDEQLSCQPAAGWSCDPRGCSIARGPELICKTPPVLGAGPHFTNVTVAARLDAAGEHVLGNRLTAEDLDGDGYPELVVHRVGGLRDDTSADPSTWNKRILRNVEGQGGTSRQFEEFTAASGYLATRDPAQDGRVAHLAVFADVNNDGNLDIFSGVYLANDAAEDPGDRSEILLGNGDGTFELAPISDIRPEPPGRRATTSAAFVDYNLDGNVDLFVGYDYGVYGLLSSAQQDRLFYGLGDGMFEDVTIPVGMETIQGAYATDQNPRPTWGVTACDVDSDGDTDLISVSYGRQLNMLWENDNGIHYRNIAQAVNADADDDLDYTTNELFKCHCQLVPGDPACTPSPGNPMIQCTSDSWNSGFDDQPWRLGGTTGTAVCGDIDNDGDMDLFTAEIRHWYHGSSSDPSQLLLNDGNGENWVFERPGNAAMGLERQWSSVDWNEGDITASFLDFDNDGLQDIFIGSSDYPNTHDFLFRQRADHTFEDVSEASGADHYYGNGHALLDFDRDGDLDLAIGSSTMRCSSDPNCPWTEPEVHLYRNDVGQDSNWMVIRLVGAGEGQSNVSAVGARVVVTAGGVTQLREVQGGYGHFGLHKPFAQYFGLGDACVADQVTIYWPNVQFAETHLHWIPANYFVTVHEADGSVTYEPAP